MSLKTSVGKTGDLSSVEKGLGLLIRTIQAAAHPQDGTISPPLKPRWLANGPAISFSNGGLGWPSRPASQPRRGAKCLHGG